VVGTITIDLMEV